MLFLAVAASVSPAIRKAPSLAELHAPEPVVVAD
jgi:hypothetical protein